MPKERQGKAFVFGSTHYNFDIRSHVNYFSLLVTAEDVELGWWELFRFELDLDEFVCHALH